MKGLVLYMAEPPARPYRAFYFANVSPVQGLLIYLLAGTRHSIWRMPPAVQAHGARRESPLALPFPPVLAYPQPQPLETERPLCPQLCVCFPKHLSCPPPPPPPPTHRLIWNNPMSRLAGLLIAVIALTLAAAPAYAATINIDADCQLDEAVANANNNNGNRTDCEAGSGTDTIVFPSGTGSISISSAISVSSNIIINGNGRVLDGGGGNRLFNKSSGTLTINDLTIQNFSTSGLGGAINSTGGAININRSAFLNNSSGGAGAIRSSGALTINRSYFVGNNSGSGGGGAIYTDNLAGANLVVRNSTFSGNIAGTYWVGNRRSP